MARDAFVLISTLLWCGCSGGGGSGGIPPDAETSTGRFKLSVSEAQKVNHVGMLRPAADHVFVDVGLTLENMGENVPLPLSAAAFTLETTDALVFDTSPASANVTAACANVGIALGGMVSCHVVFEVSPSTTAGRLAYSDAEGRSAKSALVELAPLGSCLGWPATPSQACNTCITAAAAVGAACRPPNEGAGQACATEVSMQCLETTNKCPQIKATCNASESCEDALGLFRDCLFDQCDAACK